MGYENITELDLSYKCLNNLPDFSKYTNLKNLNCSPNKLTTLDNLPPGLKQLDYYSNNINSLNNLPYQLK
jgi:Leucine-rich repeat (LRR) protein